MEHDLVARELTRPHLSGQDEPVLRAQAVEERALREEVGDLGGVHVR